jgi:hypothetical protein
LPIAIRAGSVPTIGSATKGRFGMGLTATMVRSVRVTAVCAAASLLVGVGTATAASRGFTIRNTTERFRLKLESVTPVRETICTDKGKLCIPTLHPMEWEGRPPDGSVISPSGGSRWELKSGIGTWAAKLRYAIEPTPRGVFDVTILTNGLSLDSTCTILNTDVPRCDAVGVRIEFKNRSSPPQPR